MQSLKPWLLRGLVVLALVLVAGLWVMVRPLQEAPHPTVTPTRESSESPTPERPTLIPSRTPLPTATPTPTPNPSSTPQPSPKTVFYSEHLSVEQGIVANGVMTHVEGKGTFWHGPYVSLPRGNYTVKYWLKLDKPYNGTLIDLDVATNEGNEPMKFLTISGSNFKEVNQWKSFEIKFTLDDTSIVEFRGVNVRETAPISLLSIDLYSEPVQSTQPDATQTPQPTPTTTPTSSPDSTTQPNGDPPANWMLYLIPATIALVIFAVVLAWKIKR